MKFSIVVPVYNVECYVEEALNSLLAQDYPLFEVLMIDDGSTDNSPAICKSFSQKDSRFKYIRQNNQGLSVARNVGLKHCTGDAIYFFDSDDLLRSNSLSMWAREFGDEEVDAILFGAEPFASDDNVTYLPKYNRNVHGRIKTRSDKYIADSLEGKFYMPSACCFVTRKYKLDGLQFFPKIIHEDELFYFELFGTGSMIISVDEETYFKRRLRSGSIMTSSNLDFRIFGYLTVLDGCLAVQDNIKNKKVNLNFNRILSIVAELITKQYLAGGRYIISFKDRIFLLEKYKKYHRFSPIDFGLLLKVMLPDLYVLYSKIKVYCMNRV